MIADLKAKAVDWPKYLPGAQMAVNNLPSPSLGGLSPNDIISGTSRPPHAIVIVDVDQERVKNFIEDMSLHERIKELAEARNKFQFFLQKYYDKREEQVQNHETVRLRITARISDWEYEIEDIETKVKSKHHIKNLRFLNQKDIGTKLSDDGLF